MIPKWLQRKLLNRSAPPSETTRRGNQGEDLAAEYISADLGYKLVDRNWRSGRHEIDIICWDGPVLVFVEVRSRAAEAMVSGFYTINRDKKAAIRKACLQYLKGCRPRPRVFRFDVAEIRLGVKDDPVRYFHNVPLFSKYQT